MTWRETHDDEGVAERGDPARGGIALCGERGHIERARPDGSEDIELESGFENRRILVAKKYAIDEVSR